jgi:hypothetical protein
VHRLSVGRASAATILGFALNRLTAVTIAELNTVIAGLRQGLGSETYESLARGEAMTTSAVAAYAYDQIDKVRAALEGSG